MWSPFLYKKSPPNLTDVHLYFVTSFLLVKRGSSKVPKYSPYFKHFFFSKKKIIKNDFLIFFTHRINVAFKGKILAPLALFEKRGVKGVSRVFQSPLIVLQHKSFGNPFCEKNYRLKNRRVFFDEIETH